MIKNNNNYNNKENNNRRNIRDKTKEKYNRIGSIKAYMIGWGQVGGRKKPKWQKAQ